MARLSAFLRREWLSLILGGAVVVLFFNCLTAPRGVEDLLVLRAHRTGLEAALKRIRAENSDLETRVEKLRSDDRYLQKIIRTELGFARPDELVYRFTPSGAAELERH